MSVNEALLEFAGREEGGEDVEWVWLCGECVIPPIQEMKLLWVLHSRLVECVCSVAMSVVCVKLRASGGWCP